MSPDYRTADLSDDVTFDELVKELDAILDAWFLDEIAPALESARQARAALGAARAADATGAAAA